MRALLLALLLAACAAQTPTEPAMPAPLNLDGTSWRLAGGDAARPPTLEFTETGASGFGGCNRWFASVTREASALRFGGVGSTEMACPPPAMAAEQHMFDALNRTAAYRADAEELVLLDAGGETVARFSRAD